jgi:hypothetical protein
VPDQVLSANSAGLSMNVIGLCREDLLNVPYLNLYANLMTYTKTNLLLTLEIATKLFVAVMN